jgi:hypothetical protein
VLSKLILVVLLLRLASKLGLKTKLRDFKPRLDRAVNITLVVLGVAYVGQLVWLFTHRPGH